MKLPKNKINKEIERLKGLKINRAWLISDIHLGVRAASEQWITIIEEYFDNFFIPLLKMHKKEDDVIFILGDVYDNRSSLNLKVLNSGITIFEKLSEILPIIVYPGNHDLYKMNSTDVNSIKSLKWIPNVYLIENPCVINTGDKKSLIVPWVGDFEIESKILSSNSADYAFMHTDFAGMRYDKYNLIDKGVNPKLSQKFKKIFSGHIHTRQEYENIVMIGSPYPLTRNDIGNEKGIYCLDFMNDTTEFYKNTYSPKFVRYKMEYLEEFSPAELRTKFGNDFIDVVVNAEYFNDFNSFVELFPDVRDFNFINEKFVNKNNSGNAVSKNIELLENMDIVKLCEEYIDNLSESSDEYIPDSLKTDILLKVKHLYNSAIDNIKTNVSIEKS